MTNVLVTGSAGFIGYHTAKILLEQGFKVTGIDSISNYYDIELKQHRHSLLEKFQEFSPVVGDICNTDLINDVFRSVEPEIVFHFAAQAGVRDSIRNPRIYFEANLRGTFELLEAARRTKPKHILIASTSSAYGANSKLPFRETDRADHQVSFYAASKKATENMAHSYSHLYELPTTVFRFFTVYGPWGRPDMALFKFTKNILNSHPIEVYNHGNMKRDFTYIDDLTAILLQLMENLPSTPKYISPDLSATNSTVAPYRLLNIGNEQPVALIDFVHAIQDAIGIQAKINFLPLQPGDMEATWSNNSALIDVIGPQKSIDIRTGIKRFVNWYRDFYDV